MTTIRNQSGCRAGEGIDPVHADQDYADAQAELGRREERGGGLRQWPMTPRRRTREEIEGDYRNRTVVCCYCGHREVPEDNECGNCGVLRTSKGVA